MFSSNSNIGILLLFRALLLAVLSIYTIMSNSLSGFATASFYVYVTIIVLSLFVSRKMSVDVIWLTGVILMIMSEMLFMGDRMETILVSKYILLGNNVVILSYYFARNRARFKEKKYVIANRTWYIIVCLLATIVFVVVVLPKAVYSIRYGRNAAEDIVGLGLFGTIVEDFGYIIPVFWAYYFKGRKKGILWSFVLSLPFFILLFMNGTRFPLLFSLLGYVLATGYVDIYNFKIKDFIVVALGVAIFMNASNMMKDMRVLGWESAQEIDRHEKKGLSLPQRIVSYGSSEGIVMANIWLHDYCSRNGYTYGKQSAFVFYWWVPRSIWHSKPKMTGGWLPYLYGNYGEGHSASVGIWGELYVDFGYFSFLFFILWGFLLKRIESYCEFIYNKNGRTISIGIVAVLYPFVFFASRSPITSFITLVTSMALYFMFLKLSFVGKSSNNVG